MKTSLQDAIDFNQLPFVVWSLDVETEAGNIVFGKVHYMNDSVTSITGWTNQQIKSDPNWWIDHVHPDDRSMVISQTRRLFKQPSIQFEYRFQTSSGDYIWCCDDVYVIERNGKTFKVFGTSKEINNLKALESKNDELDRLFNDVVKQVPVGLLVFKEKIIHANPAFEILSGYTEDELLHYSVWSLLDRDLQPLFKQKVHQRLKKWLPPSHYTDVPCHTKNRTLKHVELHVSSIEIDGEPAGVLVVTDKTENLKLQRSLKLQSEILANIYDSIVVFKVADKKIIYTNQVAYQSLGYKKHELIGSKWKHLFSPKCWSEQKAFINETLEHDKKITIELEQQTKQGELVVVESNIQVHNWNDTDIAVCVARDITQRKLHQKRLEFSNELYNLHSGVNQLLTKVADREELCRRLSECIIANSSIDAAWSSLVDEEEQLLTIKHTAGKVSDDFEGSVFPLIYGQKTVETIEPNLMVNAALNNEIVYSENLEQLSPFLSDNKMNYAISIPLRQLNRVIGVVTLVSKTPRFSSPQEQALHQDIAQDLHFMLNRFDEQMESHLFFESVKQSPNWMLICDHKGRIEFVNDSVLKTSGYTREELIGQSASIFKSGQHDDKFYKNFWETIKNGDSFNAFFTNKNKFNEIFILDETVVPIKHCQGFKYVSLGRDISKEVELKQELSYLSFNDPITKLHNREYLLQELPQVLNTALRQKTYLALMVVDVKNFAMINDTYGFETGNLILKKLAKRFKKHVSDSNLVVRFGSDEFAILIQDLPSIELAYSLVDSIFSTLNKSIKLKGYGEKIQLGGDMGVVTFPDGATTVDELLHNVDLALVKAKKTTGSGLIYYEQEMNKEAKSYLTTHNALTKAVKNNDFELHYQPYFDAKTERFVGFESLVRWRKDGELVYPNHFINELESSGMILKVEDFIIETVFNHLIDWKTQFQHGQRGSINLSATNFKHQNLFERIQDLVSKTKVNPHCVTFEVVESALVEDTEYAQTVFAQLRELGFKIAIDDFGTGYSSFGYLLDLPADYLKIDISFIRKIKTDDKALAIVEGIINMAHSLEMETIAEGVEDLETFRLLKVIGCDTIQGYYKARPLPCDEFNQFLVEQSSE